MSSAAAGVEPLEVTSEELPAVRGFLHRPLTTVVGSLVLTHGAGGDARTPLLVDLAAAFCADGIMVLRCDLPYRQARPKGPPTPATAPRDRDGLRHAVRVVRSLAAGPVFLGGLSYGGRQASLLAADEPKLTDALLLLSYPLHPPGRPTELRTAHWPRLQTPALFVHGSGDPFGSPAELEAARALIPVTSAVMEVEGGHDLGYARARRRDLPARIASTFRGLVG